LHRPVVHHGLVPQARGIPQATNPRLAARVNAQQISCRHMTESPLLIGSPHDVLPAEPYTAMLRSSANVRTNASATSGDLRSTVRFFVTSFGSTSILPELVSR